MNYRKLWMDNSKVEIYENKFTFKMIFSKYTYA